MRNDQHQHQHQHEWPSAVDGAATDRSEEGGPPCARP